MINKLLVMDDEDQIRHMIKRHFSSISFEVDEASSVEDAIALVDKNEYAAVICDLRLNFLDHSEGLDLVKYIKKHKKSPATIIFSAHDSQEVQKIARRLGVDEFVVKPAKLVDLEKVVMKVTGIKKR